MLQSPKKERKRKQKENLNKKKNQHDSEQSKPRSTITVLCRKSHKLLATFPTKQFGFQLFTGVSGPVGIDAKGDRVASYRLQSFLKGMSSVRVANYFGTTGQLQLLNQTIIWPGGTTQIPLGRPACGFDNEFCKKVAEGMKQIK